MLFPLNADFRPLSCRGASSASVEKLLVQGTDSMPPQDHAMAGGALSDICDRHFVLRLLVGTVFHPTQPGTFTSAIVYLPACISPVF